MDDVDERFALASRLSRAIVAASEQVKANFGEVVSAFDLVPHQGRAVLFLEAPAPMSELAARLGYDRSYVTAIADGLEERGLIERVPGADRRVKLLTLTDRGREVRRQIADGVAEHSIVLDRLTPEQCATLGPILDALLTAERSAPPRPDGPHA